VCIVERELLEELRSAGVVAAAVASAPRFVSDAQTTSVDGRTTTDARYE
jgi:hypothetical protein